MTNSQLNRIETIAIEQAGTAAFDHLLGALLEEIWSAGIRNLEDLNGEKVAIIAEKAREAPQYRAALELFLKQFGSSLKAQLDSNEAPF